MNQEIVEFTAFLLHYTAQRDFSLTVSSTDCCASTPLSIQLANTSPWATEYVAWMTWEAGCVVHEIPWQIWMHLSIFKTSKIRTCDFWDKRNDFVSSLEMKNVVMLSVVIRVRSCSSHNVLLTLALWGFFFWHRVPSSPDTATDCNGWVIAFWTAVSYKAPITWERKTASSNTEILIRARIRGRSTFGGYQMHCVRNHRKEH